MDIVERDDPPLDDKLAEPVVWGKVAGLTAQELKPDLFDECLRLIENYLIPEEAMCVALDLQADAEGCRSLLANAKECMRDGTSIVILKGDDYEDELLDEEGGAGEAGTVSGGSEDPDEEGSEPVGVREDVVEVPPLRASFEVVAVEEKAQTDAEDVKVGEKGDKEEGEESQTSADPDKANVEERRNTDGTEDGGERHRGKGEEKEDVQTSGEGVMDEEERRRRRERKKKKHRRKERERRRREAEEKHAAKEDGEEGKGQEEHDVCEERVEDLEEQEDEDDTEDEDEDDRESRVVAVMVARVVQRIEHMRSFSRIKVVQGEAYQKWLALRCHLQRTANLFDAFDVDTYYRLYHIVVHPDHRKKGVGSFLVRLAAQRLAGLFAGPGATLCTAVAPSRANQRLLARQGFRPQVLLNYHEWRDEQGEQVVRNAGVGNYNVALTVFEVAPRAEGEPPDTTPLVDAAEEEAAEPGPPTAFPGRALGLPRPPSPECPPAHEEPPFAVAAVPVRAVVPRPPSEEEDPSSLESGEIDSSGTSSSSSSSGGSSCSVVEGGNRGGSSGSGSTQPSSAS